MQLYFLPMACSLATRISLYEAGAQAEYIEVDAKTKRMKDGKDFREVNPLGLVPTLRTDEGELLTENAAVLQYVAEAHPQAGLAPEGSRERLRLRQWLSFIGTELHKGLFVALLDAKAPEGARAYALEKGATRLAFLDKYLTGREFLLERFSVADAYLFTVLNWSSATPVELEKYPALQAYVSRLRKRPSIAKALSEEFALYLEEQQRATA